MTESVPKVTPEMIRYFDGEGDLMAWLAKAKLVAKLAKISDLACFLPLYLEGNALAVYLEMPEKDRACAVKIEEKLKDAFSDSAFVAYSKLAKLKWSGEPVDVFATEVRRLVGLCGLKGEGADISSRLAFITGFPEAIRVELEQIEGVEKMTVADLLPRTRVLVGNRTDTVSAVSKLAISDGNRGGHRRVPKTDRSRAEGQSDMKFIGGQSSFQGKCFICEGPHIAKNCPNKKVKCYTCAKEGHMSYECPKNCPNNKIKCYTCAKEGHMSYECPEN